MQVVERPSESFGDATAAHGNGFNSSYVIQKDCLDGFTRHVSQA